MSPNKIRSLMVAQGIKQVDIARDLGVNRSVVCGVIHGRWPSRRISQEIAARLNLPLEHVFPRYAA